MVNCFIKQFFLHKTLQKPKKITNEPQKLQQQTLHYTLVYATTTQQQPIQVVHFTKIDINLKIDSV